MGRPGALSHLRILDFTALLQGPLATQVLGDLGAEVIKIERVEGEWMRHWGILMTRTHGEVDSFLAFNRNKKSAAVDLRDDRVRQRILELAAEVDVVVENFRPGVMDRLGIGYEQLKAVNPAIIYACSSGYGQTGPYSKRPGQDMLAQALSGVMWLSGRRDDPPTALGVGFVDMYTGLHLAVAILAALEHRRETGAGQRVEVDLLACAIAAQQQELTVHLNQGPVLERAEGNVGHVGGTAPFGIYATADGHITLAMFPCPRLAEILSEPWLAEYETNEQMYASRDVIYERLSKVFSRDATAAWIDLLTGHGVWCAPVQSYDDLERDPQVAHRGLFWDVPIGDGDDATFRTVGSPFVFSETPPSVSLGVPRIGQHTSEYFPVGDHAVGGGRGRHSTGEGS